MSPVLYYQTIKRWRLTFSFSCSTFSFSLSPPRKRAKHSMPAHSPPYNFASSLPTPPPPHEKSWLRAWDGGSERPTAHTQQNLIQIPFSPGRRTDQTTENDNSQEMAVCLFSRMRRSKGHEQELKEELLQSPRIGIENYPARKAFAIHLSDSHSSTRPP